MQIEMAGIILKSLLHQNREARYWLDRSTVCSCSDWSDNYFGTGFSTLI